MTFLHKLARRLAGVKTALIMAAVATIACEIPLATDPSSIVALLQLSPKTLTLRIDQIAQFVAVGLTSTGDTAKIGVTWSATGGSIVDTGTSGGKLYVHYKAPSQPGQYKVIIQSTTAGPSTQRAIAGLSTQTTAAGLSDSAVVNVTAVPVAAVSVSPASASATVGQTAQLTATPLDSIGAALTGRVVTWASSNSGIATVSTSGLVRGVAAGSVTITATSEGKSGTSAVTVTPPPVASVSVSPSAVSTTVGQAAQFTVTLQDATGNLLTGRVVTWGSSNTGVATVSSNGLVTPVAAGLAIITATSEGKNGTAGITVTLTPAAVASVSVSPASANVTAGQTVQLTATVRDASGNVLLGRVVTWASSNAGLVTVSGSGLVTGLAAGAATITATSEGQSGSAAVTITVPVASVNVSPASTSVIAGQTVQLTATPLDASGNPLTGRVVTWTSSNTGRATVNGSGLVTGVSTGSVTITATSEGRSGTAAVTVTPVPVASVTVSPATASVPVGQTVQLTATPRDANGNPLTGRTITWSSNASGVATVSGSGLVSGVALGSATITATSEGQSGSSAVSVTAPAPVASVSVSPASTSVTVGFTVQLTATPRDANGNALIGRVVTWASSNTGVATVNGSGLVTSIAVGVAIITATSEGKSGTASVTVVQPLPPDSLYPHQPAGFVALVDQPWSTMPSYPASAASGWWQGEDVSQSAIISDPTAPQSPNSILATHVPAHCCTSGYSTATITRPDFKQGGGAYYRKLYVSAWIKHSANWVGHPVGSKHLFFVHPDANSTGYADIYTGWSRSQMSVGFFQQGYATKDYYANTGDGTRNNAVGFNGTWQHYEYLVTLDTGGNDGAIQVWVDGHIVMNYTGQNFGSFSPKVWTGILYKNVYGGGPGDANDQYEYMDHLYVSGSN